MKIVLASPGLDLCKAWMLLRLLLIFLFTKESWTTEKSFFLSKNNFEKSYPPIETEKKEIKIVPYFLPIAWRRVDFQVNFFNHCRTISVLLCANFQFFIYIRLPFLVMSLSNGERKPTDMTGSSGIPGVSMSMAGTGLNLANSASSVKNARSWSNLAASGGAMQTMIPPTMINDHIPPTSIISNPNAGSNRNIQQTHMDSFQAFKKQAKDKAEKVRN